MFGAPSEASILRSILEKVTGTDTHRKEQLESILEFVRASELTILKNRNLHVDEQIIGFANILSKIKEIALK
jgi:hypothetical protein